jgi:hypothetical protein
MLLMALIFVGLGAIMLMGALNWSSQNTRDTFRGNEYYTTSAAAEAATEKVLVRISRDYINNGESSLYNSLGSYRSVVPTSADNAYWANYNFTAPASGASGLAVNRVMGSQFVVLSGQYSGLYGYRSTYRIAANAQSSSSLYGVKSSVWQDIGVESIPLFQFAIFYTMDLEIEPGANMIVTGRVHSNSNLWVMPGTNVSLTFSNDVTCSSQIYPNNMPGDPDHTTLANPNITYLGAHDGGTSTLNLPIGTNNSPSNVNQVLQIPPGTESSTSPMGTNRFYNKADLIILISNATVTVTSGVGLDNRATIVADKGPNSWTNFMTTNAVFYNGREQTNVLATQFDVGKFATWAQSSSNVLKGKLVGKSTANIVYIADMRTSSQYEPGVRLVNGSELPNSGLTVASPDPVYIQGDYNTTTDGINYSTNVNTTTYTYPAAVMGDAITILSNGWNDSNGLMAPAADTTVNAALLGGIVPTSSVSYSGGVENFPRFLEKWTGHSLWYNGSMVVMFNSEIATGPWNTPGYYSPPARHWAFDTNFNTESKLPPGTPQILFIERLHWAMMPPSADPTDTTDYSSTNYSAWPVL